MSDFIRNLTARGEFILVCVVSFTYPIVASVVVMFLRPHVFEMSLGRVAHGAVVEILLLTAVGAILHTRGWHARDLGLRFSWLAILNGVPLLLAFLMSYWIVSGTAIFFGTWHSRFSVRTISSAPFVAALAFFVINSVYEEVIVAAYVIEALEDHGPAFAVTASTLLRFAYHLYQGPIAVLSILPMGLIFGATYWRWRSVWPLMVAHTIMNVLIFARGLSHG